MEKIATTLPSYQLFVDCSHTQIVSSIQLSMAFIAVSFVPGRVCLRIPHVPSPRKDMLFTSMADPSVARRGGHEVESTNSVFNEGFASC